MFNAHPAPVDEDVACTISLPLNRRDTRGPTRHHNPRLRQAPTDKRRPAGQNLVGGRATLVHTRAAPARAPVDHSREDIVRAYVTICTPIGQEIVTVHVEDYDPFITLSVHGQSLELTRTESRQVADALRAAALRYPGEPLRGDAV